MSRPQSVDRQVVMLFAGVRGYLDRIDLNRIGEFESRLHTFLASSALLYPFLRALSEGVDVEDGLFRAVLERFVDAFLATPSSGR
jgi:F-type H+-transporting ATPase subunit alpha